LYFRLAGKKFGRPTGMKKPELKKAKRNEPKNSKFQPEKWKIEKYLQLESWGYGH